MSVEIAIITTFLGAAYMVFRLASDRTNTDTETGDGPDFMRVLYIMVGFMFVLGALFSGGKIAGQNGYPGVQNVLNWSLTAGLVVFALLGALILWDFVQKIMDQVNNDEWGW